MKFKQISGVIHEYPSMQVGKWENFLRKKSVVILATTHFLCSFVIEMFVVDAIRESGRCSAINGDE